MTRVIAIVILLRCFPSIFSGDECRCRKPIRGETTHQGGNEEVVFTERVVYQKLRGIVRDESGNPMSDVLIEVFNHPEYLLYDYAERAAKKTAQRRIAACKTGADGGFCFIGVPRSSYELRASKDVGWNPSHIYLRVDPHNYKHTEKEVHVELTVGK